MPARRLRRESLRDVSVMGSSSIVRLVAGVVGVDLGGGGEASFVLIRFVALMATTA
jgi:hypothetical protein